MTANYYILYIKIFYVLKYTLSNNCARNHDKYIQKYVCNMKAEAIYIHNKITKLYEFY